MSKGLNSDFLSPDELAQFGVSDAAERNILVHRTAVIVNFDAITFGRHVRIDPFVVVSCKELVLGDYVHIATGAGLFGAARITYGDFSGTSAHCMIYTSTDDYSGKAMTNPTVPNEFLNLETAPVNIGAHCVVGAGSTVLPGAQLGEGASFGAYSLIKGVIPPWQICTGIPARPVKERSRDCLALSRALKP